MEVRCFAESKGLKSLVQSPEPSWDLVKLGIALTSLGNGSGCLHMQYRCMYLEHILISPVRKGQCFIGRNWLLPFLFPPAMKDLSISDCSFWLFLPALSFSPTNNHHSAVTYSKLCKIWNLRSDVQRSIFLAILGNFRLANISRLF